MPAVAIFSALLPFFHLIALHALDKLVEQYRHDNVHQNHPTQYHIRPEKNASDGIDLLTFTQPSRDYVNK